MKIFLRFLACGLLLLSTTQSWSEPQNSEIKELDHIVAVVNSSIIMHSKLAARVTMIQARLKESGTALPQRSVLERQVLERLIVERLQLLLAEEQGIQIEDEALNENLREIARRNNLTLTQFRKVLEEDGFNFGQFREDIRTEIILGKLRRQMVENRVDVSELEVEHEIQNNRFNQDNKEYHLGHILIAVPEAASAKQIHAAKQRAESVADRLRKGADFSHMAVAESDGQKALEGGDLGWRKSGQLPSMFAEQITSMEKGDLSDPIRTPSGFHILKLLATRGDERHLISQVQARHILIRPDELVPESEVIARLGQLQQRILAGEDFATLARSHSQDSVSAANGGALGWVSRGDMVPQFEEVIFDLADGDVSKPFVTRYGWHIAQVQAHREHDSTDVFKKARARESIRKRKVEEEWALWLRRLRDEAYVDYRTEQ